MIWIPISIVLTLFGLHSFMVRSLECDRNLVEGVSEEAAEALGEVCALRSGLPTANAKILCLLLNGVSLVVPILMIVYLDASLPGLFSLRWIVIGVGAGVMLNLWPLIGFHPFQYGHILIDRERLRVPRGFGVRVFVRGETRVWIFRSSENVCSCLVRDGEKGAFFMINDESMELLKLWVRASEGECAA